MLALWLCGSIVAGAAGFLALRCALWAGILPRAQNKRKINIYMPKRGVLGMTTDLSKYIIYSWICRVNKSGPVQVKTVTSLNREGRVLKMRKNAIYSNVKRMRIIVIFMVTRSGLNEEEEEYYQIRKLACWTAQSSPIVCPIWTVYTSLEIS